MKKILLSLFIIFLQTSMQAKLLESGTDYDETISQIPFKKLNELPVLPVSCRPREKGLWDLCFSILKDDENRENRILQARSFKLKNSGDNPTFPPTGFLIGRDYEFLFEDLALAELSLLVWDVPTEKDSDGHMMLMTFLPRKVLPSIRYIESNQTNVILPTGENVIFNSLTNEIIGGVLKEGELEIDSNGHAKRPNVSYRGSGIAIVASRRGNYPVGDELTQENPRRVARNLADIFFKEKLICQIPVKDIWYTNYNKGGQVVIKPEFADDTTLIQFIEKKCNAKFNLEKDNPKDSLF